MPALTPELKEFLQRFFDSVESIEIVALLQRSSTAFWTAEAVSQQLGIPVGIVTAKLDSMAPHVLVRGHQTGAYRYAPASDETNRSVTELLQVYSEQRPTIINAIYSANLDRLRAFSDAFRLKKEP
jgi:hypothetical protein